MQLALLNYTASRSVYRAAACLSNDNYVKITTELMSSFQPLKQYYKIYDSALAQSNRKLLNLHVLCRHS